VSRLIDEDTLCIADGCVQLYVRMALHHGWTLADVQACWEKISEIARSTGRAVATRAGHTRKCEDCECWTVPDGPCHLCVRDEHDDYDHACGLWSNKP
jgi:hypothetical protein